MGPVEATLDQVVDVISVRHGLMAAPPGVFVRWVTPDRSRVATWMRRINSDYVLVDVIAVRVM
jgi:hypothetical protein